MQVHMKNTKIIYLVHLDSPHYIQINNTGDIGLGMGMVCNGQRFVGHPHWVCVIFSVYLFQSLCHAHEIHQQTDT